MKKTKKRAAKTKKTKSKRELFRNALRESTTDHRDTSWWAN